MASKKGLGRGFESLIPSDLFDDSFDPTADDDTKVSQLRELSLADIDADPNQPRQQFNETALAELTASIKKHGVLQPIVVTKHSSRHEIVAGERRYRASKLAGNKTIPAIVRTVSAQNKLELALIENLNRHDLNVLETATAYSKLRTQFNMSLDEISKTVGGKSISAISNTLRMLRLPKEVKDAVMQGAITEGQARPLIDFDEEQTLKLLPKIIAEKWTARKIEQAVRARKEPKPTLGDVKPDNYVQDRKTLEKKYDAPIKITSSKKGSGQIVISFKNADEFERIRSQLL